MAPALGLLLAGCGMWCLAVAGRNFFFALASRRWIAANGLVILSRLRMERDAESGEGYWAEVNYRYQAGGVEYVGNRIRFGRIAGSKKAVEAVLGRFPEGRPVTVWHNPHSPSQSVLEPRVSDASLLLLAIGLFLIAVSAVAWSTTTHQ